MDFLIKLTFIMKFFLLILALSFSLIGCSSIEIEAVSSSEEETQRILSLGLSHEDNIIEAKKLKSDHLISVVTLQLVNARDAKLKYQNDLIESEKIARMVLVSDNGMSFIGPKISNTLADIMNTSPVSQSYFLESSKSLNNEVFRHKIQLIYSYNASKPRGFKAANLCDDWGRCETLIQLIGESSVSFSNCSNTNCNYTEVFEIDLSDKLLRDSIQKGLRMELISNKKTDKLNLSVAYLMGYFNVVQ